MASRLGCVRTSPEMQLSATRLLQARAAGIPPVQPKARVGQVRRLAARGKRGLVASWRRRVKYLVAIMPEIVTLNRPSAGAGVSVCERAQRVLAKLDTSTSIFAVTGQAGVNPYRWQSVPLAMVRFATFRSAEGGYPAAVIACKRGSSTSATCAKPLAKEPSRRVLRRQLNQAGYDDIRYGETSRHSRRRGRSRSQ